MAVWSTFTASWVGNNYDEKKENISIPNRNWGEVNKNIYFDQLCTTHIRQYTMYSTVK